MMIASKVSFHLFLSLHPLFLENHRSPKETGQSLAHVLGEVANIYSPEDQGHQGDHRLNYSQDPSLPPWRQLG